MPEIRSQKQSLYNYSGFTLIELLVAISIVAVLATIGLVIFSGTQKNARDTRRIKDIDAITHTMESNKGTNPTYQPLQNSQFANGAVPTDTTPAKYCLLTGSTTPPTSWPDTSACPSTSWTTIAPNIPASATSWIACARLESSTASTGTGLKVYCKPSVQ